MTRTRHARTAGTVCLPVLLSLAGFLLPACKGPPPPDDPPGSFAFSAMGDAPYYFWEELQFERLLRQLDGQDLAFALSVGDILWRPCSDEMYRQRRAYFDSLRHPLIYTPGDNEWTDCHRRAPGGYEPLERLRSLRAIFFDDPSRSLGGRALALEAQAESDEFGEFVENARWSHDGVVFTTVHLVGSRNALDPFAARTAADDEEAWRRTRAAASWIREAFAVARATGARAVVVAHHADPAFGDEDPGYREAFEPYLRTLEEEVAAFDGPILLVHGDSHDLIIDRPLIDRATGRRLDNLTRLEVPGSPIVGWVRVVVDPGAAPGFTFQPQFVSRFLLW